MIQLIPEFDGATLFKISKILEIFGSSQFSFQRYLATFFNSVAFITNMASEKSWWITENGHLHLLLSSNKYQDCGLITNISSKSKKSIFVVICTLFSLPIKFTTDLKPNIPIEVVFDNISLSNNWETKPCKAPTFMVKLKALLEVFKPYIEFGIGNDLCI